MTRPPLSALAAGAAAAFLYSLSPVTAWFAVAMALVMGLGVRGLEGRERVWLLRLVGAAVVTRVAVIAAFFLATWRVDGSFAPLLPDETYMMLRALWLRSIALGLPMASGDFVESFNLYAKTGLQPMFAWVQLVLGPAPYAIRLVNVGVYVAGAVVLYRVIRTGFGARPALIGLAVVLFLPTTFVWSISLLKEPMIACLTAVAFGALLHMARPHPLPWRLIAVAVAIVALVLLRWVRSGSEVMVAVGAISGIGLAWLLRRPRLAAVVTLGVALSIPVLTPRVSPRLDTALRNMASIHLGHVKTTGYAYKLLDDDFYVVRGPSLTSTVATMTSADLARFVVRAVVSFVVVPVPWHAASPSAVAYLPEGVLWYCLWAAAAVGLVAGLGRDPQTTLALLSVVIVSALAIAISNGNVGTLVRLRDTVVIALAWLSGLGVSVVVDWWAAWQRSAERSRPDTPVLA